MSGTGPVGKVGAVPVPETSPDASSPAPLPVLVLWRVVLAEAAVLVGYGVLVLVMAVRGDRSSALAAFGLAVLLAGLGVGLAAAGRAVRRRRRWGRAPVIVCQPLGFAVGVPVAQGGALLVGLLLASGAAAGLAAALAPQVTDWVTPDPG